MNDLMTIRDTSQPRTADVLAMSTKHKSRLCFLINSMEGGGAERAMANLLHHLEGPLSDMQVDLVLLDDLPWCRIFPLGSGS